MRYNNYVIAKVARASNLNVRAFNAEEWGSDVEEVDSEED